jgi:hypothetical protein
MTEIVNVAGLDQGHAKALSLLRESREHFFLWTPTAATFACPPDDVGGVLMSIIEHALEVLEEDPGLEDVLELIADAFPKERGAKRTEKRTDERTD